MITIWLTIEHSKLGRSATNIRCEDMKLECFDELSPARACNNPTKRQIFTKAQMLSGYMSNASVLSLS